MGPQSFGKLQQLTMATPIESNPEVLNRLLAKIGMSEHWQMFDIVGLDVDQLAEVPQPVVAVMLLLPLDDKYQEAKQEKEANEEEEGVYFMKLEEACGTVALVHAVANNIDRLELEDGPLKNFISASTDLSPEEKGKKLLENDDIMVAHKEAAMEGQTQPPEEGQSQAYHIITFVQVGENLYELDGCKVGPVIVAETSEETFLEDAAVVCRSYMDRNEEKIEFSLLALAKA